VGPCDYARLKPALVAACDGDTIQVFGGDFLEDDLVIDKSLRVEGHPGVNWEMQPIEQPMVGGRYSPSTLWVDDSSPHSVTVTNISLYHAYGGDLVSVSPSAGSSLFLDRVDFNGSGPGTGVTLSSGQGTLLIQNCIFRGEEDPAARGVKIDNAAGSGGSAVVRYNTFRALSATVHVQLSGPNAYPIQLLGNIFFNDGSAGVDGLSMAGDPSASGDYNAWFGYSVFYGGLTPGSNDFPATDPGFLLPDLHFSSSSPLAYAGTNPGTTLDFYGDTRPAAAVWSIGAAEPFSPTASLSPTISPTPSWTFSPTVSATFTVTLSCSMTVTSSPSLTPTVSTTPVVPSVTVSPTAVPTVPALTLDLYSNNPNPFGTDGTYIPFRVSAPCRVEVRIYTISGQVVRDLPEAGVAAGGNELFWDGKNDHGAMAANGVFIYRVRATSQAGEVKEGYRKCSVVK
jgi:hypothetical protein